MSIIYSHFNSSIDAYFRSAYLSYAFNKDNTTHNGLSKGQYYININENSIKNEIKNNTLKEVD